MPLTPAKATHITRKLDKLFLQRSQTVTLYHDAGVVTTVQGIFRIAQTGADMPHVEAADAMCLVQARDVSLQTLRATYIVAPQAGSVANVLSATYAIVGIIPRGLLTNPDRYYLYLERSLSVNLALKNPDGSLVQLTVWGVVHPLADGDPTLAKEANDAVLYLNYPQITLAQLRSCVWVSLQQNQPPGDSAAGDIASRYLISSIAAERIPENVDRWVVTLDRQR